MMLTNSKVFKNNIKNKYNPKNTSKSVTCSDIWNYKTMAWIGISQQSELPVLFMEPVAINAN